MPLTEPITGFFTDEWERFSEGVRRLNPGSYDNLIDAHYRARRPAAERNIVSIPGLDDVIHVRPRYQPSGPERDEFWTARRERRAPQLSAEATQELDRRADLVRRIRAAPDAETAGSWGRILTAVDNVQDFLSTLSLMGRFALWAAPRILGRLTPGVNIIIALGDLLNLLNLLGLTAMPLWQLICRGPAAALAAGVPSLLFKQALKLHVWNRALRSPFGRLARLRSPLEALTRRQLTGKLLETAQTTDALFGYGLSFGVLVGLVTQGAAAAVLGARGEPVNVQRNRVSDALTGAINAPLSDDATADLYLLRQAAAVMRDAPAILRRPQHFGADELMGTMIAATEAARVVYTRLRGHPWQAIATEAADLEWPAPADAGPATQQAAAALGLDLAAGARWDVPGTPSRINGGEYARLVGAELGPALAGVITEHRYTEVGAFLGAVLNQAAEESWHAILDDADGVAWQLHPDWAILGALAEEGLLPVPGDDEQRVWAFWQAAHAALERRAGGTPPRAELEAIAARTGVTLAKLLPPGSAWPEPWHQWRQSPEGQAVLGSI